MSDRARIIERLNKPFPREAIKSRTIGGNRKADYVDGATVIRRLNEATDCQWDFTVDQYWSEPGEHGSGVTFAKVTLTIPGLGSRQHMGVQSYNERSGEDVVAKGAITDALKKAATLFGVALDLYGPDYESGEVTPAQPQNRTQRARSPERTGAPQALISESQARTIATNASQTQFPLKRWMRDHQIDRLGQLTNAQFSQLMQQIADYQHEGAELEAIGAEVE